jgi:hypothetical protein
MKRKRNPRISYTDIGHSDPKDILWIILGQDFQMVMAGATLTHELLWDKEIEQSWRGRYERSTSYCSIVPPSGVKYGRPPQNLLDTLTSQFSIIKFFYFADGAVDEFEPNPSRRKRKAW